MHLSLSQQEIIRDSRRGFVALVARPGRRWATTWEEARDRKALRSWGEALRRPEGPIAC
jgi:hypothetical protein